jgi:hypothetical protein
MKILRNFQLTAADFRVQSGNHRSARAESDEDGNFLREQEEP